MPVRNVRCTPPCADEYTRTLFRLMSSRKSMFQSRYVTAALAIALMLASYVGASGDHHHLALRVDVDRADVPVTVAVVVMCEQLDAAVVIILRQFCKKDGDNFAGIPRLDDDAYRVGSDEGADLAGVAVYSAKVDYHAVVTRDAAHVALKLACVVHANLLLPVDDCHWRVCAVLHVDGVLHCLQHVCHWAEGLHHAGHPD